MARLISLVRVAIFHMRTTRLIGLFFLFLNTLMQRITFLFHGAPGGISETVGRLGRVSSRQRLNHCRFSTPQKR